MRLSQQFASDIVEHAREGRARDAEICGVLLGTAGEASELIRVPNIAELQRTRYEMDPTALYRVQRRMDDAQLDLVAIYHSHPHTRAYPSETDRRNAHDEEGRPLWPDTTYIICSLEFQDQPVLNAFKLFPDHAEGETLDIVSGTS
jgi:proteasome lid subunit RPN8/RPN11